MDHLWNEIRYSLIECSRYCWVVQNLKGGLNFVLEPDDLIVRNHKGLNFMAHDLQKMGLILYNRIFSAGALIMVMTNQDSHCKAALYIYDRRCSIAFLTFKSISTIEQVQLGGCL